MKTLLKTLVILLLVAGFIAGGVFGYSRYTRSKPVQVQNVRNWLLEYSPNQTYLGGSVISGDSLTLYGNRERTVKEIFVTEGQQVRVGTPLIRYDTTKDSLELDEKMLERQKLYDGLEKLYREYKRYAHKDYERSIPTATPTCTPMPRAEGEATRGDALPGVMRLSATLQQDRKLEHKVGDGSKNNPYRYDIADGDPIPESELNHLQNEANQLRQTVYAVFSSPAGSLDMRFRSPDTENLRGSSSFTAFREPWSGPRSATATAELKLKDHFHGEGTLASPYLYSYKTGTEVPWSFLKECCRWADENGKYLYVQLIGTKVTDLMISLAFTSKGTYIVRLTKMPPVCTVVFNPKGGTVSPTFTRIVYGSAYGKLPVPVREDHIFAGWWTSDDDKGNQVSAKTIVTKNHTLYARWNTPTPAPSTTPGPDVTATPEGWTDAPETPYTPHWGMSREERLAYVERLTQQIRDSELSFRQLNHDIEQLITITGQNGTVSSTFDGVVSTLKPDARNGETLLEVRGGSGKSVIRCMLGETERTKYPVGTELTGYSYDIGANVTARVTYIGSMPVSDNYSNGGNPNSSGYVMLLEVLGDTELPLYSYVEFTSFEPLSKTGAIYLYEAFVREIDGQDCIFVVRDGLLKKVQVHTGRRVMEYIELVGSDLTGEDLIAFPYDKNVRDGASVEVVEDLW